MANFFDFFKVSVTGAEIVAKSRINRLYYPAVPRKLLTSRVVFGSFIASTFTGSVFNIPPPIINPRYLSSWKQNCDFLRPMVRFASFRQFATSFKRFKCSSNVLEITSKSSKYIKTLSFRRCGITLSINLHSR